MTWLGAIVRTFFIMNLFNHKMCKYQIYINRKGEEEQKQEGNDM